MSNSQTTSPDLCVKDGQLCYVSAGTDDAHHRCGTILGAPPRDMTWISHDRHYRQAMREMKAIAAALLVGGLVLIVGGLAGAVAIVARCL